MTDAGLSKELIVRKIKESGGRYDVSAQGLIALKKAGVADDAIALMLDKNEKNPPPSVNPPAENLPQFSENTAPSVESKTKSHVVVAPKEALRTAKTVAITKSSANPSRQALEKELLKRGDWKRLNLNLVRYKDDADLFVEIGFVPLSLITHRYVYRIYDNKSGTVMAAGETTSWGSLTKNLARHIAKSLNKIADLK